MMTDDTLQPVNDDTTSRDENGGGGGGAHLVLWLIILSLSIFLAPLYLISVTLEENTAALSAELTGIQATLQATPQVDTEEEALRQDYMGLQADLQALENVQAQLQDAQVNLPQIMAAIGTYDPAQIKLTTITQADDLLTVSGGAVTEAAALDYADTLIESDLFAQVSIQSIQLADSGGASDAGQDENHTPDPYRAAFVLLLER